jgi:protein-S-isoprenylcysteine O-methyltransferase Ste14
MPLGFSIIIWPFFVFLAFWVITWRSVKKNAEVQNASGWFLYWIFGLIGAVLLFGLTAVSSFNTSALPSSLALQSLGFLIELLGLCFAIWARITLGRNWSSTVTFKEKHELVTRGPYRLVRHPIYTGLLAMFLGAAIYLGPLVGFIGVLSLFMSFWIKSRQEEMLMTKHFKSEYTNYKKRTKALIPFIY